MHAPTFDRCGLASLAELDGEAWRRLFDHLDAEQKRFLEHEAEFRSAEYTWPREALRNWSRVWEYPYVHHHLRVERERLGRNMKLVDVGSGVAFFPFANARLDATVVCVDNDPVCVRDMGKAIQAVDAAPGACEARLSDGRGIPVDDGWADALVSVSVMEHVDDKPALAESMARALAPGGLLVLTMDLDLRGDQEIDPVGRRELLRTLDAHFEPAYATQTVHPRDVLLSTNGPYGFVLPPAWPLLRFRVKQWLRGLASMDQKPIYPFELAVEALVLRRR